MTFSHSFPIDTPSSSSVSDSVLQPAAAPATIVMVTQPARFQPVAIPVVDSDTAPSTALSHRLVDIVVTITCLRIKFHFGSFVRSARRFLLFQNSGGWCGSAVVTTDDHARLQLRCGGLNYAKVKSWMTFFGSELA